ncbi:MAG: hypothetical protein HOO06_14125 [Bdellovibrionaceae bacterium]|jgi:hypothetical protein|nr:hypothetical protein [Pseudobdellovibrionaceae bacterium]
MSKILKFITIGLVALMFTSIGLFSQESFAKKGSRGHKKVKKVKKKKKIIKKSKKKNKKTSQTSSNFGIRTSAYATGKITNK